MILIVNFKIQNMVVLSALNLEQQLSGRRFTACAQSKSVAAVSSESKVDIYHDNEIISEKGF